MENNILEIAKKRYSAKSYDAAKKISAEDLEALKQILQMSPSSVNIQPWHFIIAQSDEAKAKVAKATGGNYQFNTKAILDASHVVVFSTKLDVDLPFLESITDKEEADGRFNGLPEVREQMHNGRIGYTEMLKSQEGLLQLWMAKQTYLNVGQFMLAATAMGIDTTPMEGFDAAVIDAEFDLTSKGFTSSVVVPMGYRNEAEDYNANIPKSRLELNEIISVL